LYGPWRYWGFLALFSVAGILVFIKVVRLRVVEEHTKWLQFTGRNSIIYYCSHFPALLGVVYFARVIGLPVEAVIPIGFVFALGIGTALALGSRHAPLSWLFVAPFGGGAARVTRFPEARFLTERDTRSGLAVAQVTMSAIALLAMIALCIRWL
jgi:hypothetical protein